MAKVKTWVCICGRVMSNDEYEALRGTEVGVIHCPKCARPSTDFKQAEEEQ